VNEIIVSFATIVPLQTGVVLMISMPQHLVLPPDGGSVKGITPGVNDNQYSVGDFGVDREIKITNFAEPGPVTLYTFSLSGIENQISEKDAGGFTIRTMYDNNGKYYV
jgi:hypothetical protein